MRNSLACLTLGTILAATTTLLAQEAPAIPVPSANETADLMRRVADLERDVGGLKAKTSQHDDDLRVLANRVLNHDESIKAHGPSIESNTSAIARLAQGFNTHQQRFDTHEQRILANERNVRDNNQKLSDIAKFDTSSGRYRLDLLGNMQSPEFRSEFRSEIRSEVDRSSRFRLVISNYTGREQLLYINGTQWRVRNGRSAVSVASGPVTVQRLLSNGVWRDEVLNSWVHDGTGYKIEYNFPIEYYYPLDNYYPTPRPFASF